MTRTKLLMIDNYDSHALISRAISVYLIRSMISLRFFENISRKILA